MGETFMGETFMGTVFKVEGDPIDGPSVVVTVRLFVGQAPNMSPCRKCADRAFREIVIVRFPL